MMEREPERAPDAGNILFLDPGAGYIDLFYKN